MYQFRGAASVVERWVYGANMVGFVLKFDGNDAVDHELDFYDAAQAMVGFQRSLAVTTHLVLNGKVITQAPSLKNARIFVVPPEQGSWKVKATIVGSLLATGAYNLGTAARDTPLGHLVHSAYDYVVSESLGFHVDYEKSLGEQYKELKRQGAVNLPHLDQSRFDSVIEKCERSIKDMHRPIIKSETATSAQLSYFNRFGEYKFNYNLSSSSYDYMIEDILDKTPEDILGRVSSYNINTYKGRVYVEGERRSIPFVLSEEARGIDAISIVTRSLSANAVSRAYEGGDFFFRAFANRSKTGRLKYYHIVMVHEGYPSN